MRKRTKLFKTKEKLNLYESKEEIIKEDEDKKYTYVYGITNNKPINLKIKGLKEEPIKTISFKDILVLTSSYPTLSPVLKEEEVMQYTEILKKITQKTTIIPMSFGTVFKDQKILEKVLAKSYKALKITLKLVEGKIELGVKAIKNQLEYIPNKAKEQILESLNKLSVKSKEGDNFSERLLLNYSFLVKKANFSKFSEEIANLEKEYKDLKFIYTGPWPPYSFVNIKISGSGS